MIEKTAKKQVAELTKAPKIKPSFLPIFPIIFAATIVKIAVPRTAKAVGTVDKDFTEVMMQMKTKDFRIRMYDYVVQ